MLNRLRLCLHLCKSIRLREVRISGTLEQSRLKHVANVREMLEAVGVACHRH